MLHNAPHVFPHIDQMRRILIGLGCIPAICALYFRFTIPETPRFTMDVERNVKQAVDDIERFLSTGGYKFDPDLVIVRVQAPRSSVRASSPNWRPAGALPSSAMPAHRWCLIPATNSSANASPPA